MSSCVARPAGVRAIFAQLTRCSIRAYTPSTVNRHIALRLQRRVGKVDNQLSQNSHQQQNFVQEAICTYVNVPGQRPAPVISNTICTATVPPQNHHHSKGIMRSHSLNGHGLCNA